jgi:autotransporter passenger strand-loop-strand repeat protein
LTDYVISSGVTTGYTLQSGDTLTVQSGGTSLDTIVNSGATETVQSGGTVSDAQVLSGGAEVLSAGGIESGTTVASGGALFLADEMLSAVASGTSFTAGPEGGVPGVNFEYGAVIDLVGAVVTPGGSLDVVTGGLIVDTVVLSSAYDTLQGGMASGTVVSDGGAEYMILGSVAYGTVLSSGGQQYAQFGGIASGTIVSQGGSETITVSGSALQDVILSGGIEYVVNGGNASGTVVSNGGIEWVQSSSFDSGAILSSGGIEYIESGGTATGTIVSSGGMEVVLSGGIASATQVLSGGTEVISAGGVELPSEVHSPDAGGTGAIVSSGGALAVGDARIGDGMIFTAAVQLAATMVSGVTLKSGAVLDLSRPIVSSGGRERISSGAATAATLVRSGGVATILAHGLARETVLSGGYEFVYGKAYGTVVHYGGHEVVLAGATDAGSLIGFGGQEIVSFGGAADAATVFADGTLFVASGGELVGGLGIRAGNAVISGAMAAGQTVSFTGSTGVLALDNLAGFRADISGLGAPNQQIDLGGFAYASSETASWTPTGTSGTLVITDGAKTASLTLIGSYVSGDFQLSDDGHGGTLLSDPAAKPAAEPAPSRFAQAVAGFSGREQGLAAIHTGGTALIGATPQLTAGSSGR